MGGGITGMRYIILIKDHIIINYGMLYRINMRDTFSFEV